MLGVDFQAAMRLANEKQKALYVINKLLFNDNSALQILFTRPAACSKTFL